MEAIDWSNADILSGHLCTFNVAATFFRGHPYIWSTTVRHDRVNVIKGSLHSRVHGICHRHSPSSTCSSTANFCWLTALYLTHGICIHSQLTLTGIPLYMWWPWTTLSFSGELRHGTCRFHTGYTGISKINSVHGNLKDQMKLDLCI